jgi:hypothetical protein
MGSPIETLKSAQDLLPGSLTQPAPFRRIAVCVDGSSNPPRIARPARHLTPRGERSRLK